MINEILLIFAIRKMYMLIKSQTNSETRTIQFLLAISIALVALISVPLSAFYYPGNDIDPHKYLMDWFWVEGFLSIAQFQFQMTILGFCWVYATRPRPQIGKSENAENENGEPQV